MCYLSLRVAKMVVPAGFSAGNRVASNAFLSPRWGGILIYNTETPGNGTAPTTISVDVKRVMEVFLTQLRLLLNIHVQVAGLFDLP